jgi:hypothetical protein
MIDTYAGWKGVAARRRGRARVAGARKMLAAPHEEFDPTLPGLFASDPPAKFVTLLSAIAAIAAIAADVRPATLAHELAIMAETDLATCCLTSPSPPC